MKADDIVNKIVHKLMSDGDRLLVINDVVCFGCVRFAVHIGFLCKVVEVMYDHEFIDLSKKQKKKIIQAYLYWMNA